MAPSTKKKILRNILCLACDLKPAIDIIYSGQADNEDESPLFKTDGKTIHALLDNVNKTFTSLLKL